MAGVTAEQSKGFEDLLHKMPPFLTLSRSHNTNVKYLSYFKRFKSFMLDKSHSYLPANSIHVACFIVHLLERKMSPHCVNSFVYSIKWAHQLRGLPDPTSNAYVKTLMESGKRMHTVPKKKKSCIPSEVITSLFSSQGQSDDPVIVRDLAIIILCFCAFLRYDEVSNLRCNDVSFYSDYVKINIKKSKTDQYRLGNEVVLSKLDSDACSFKALHKYIVQNEYLYLQITICLNLCSGVRLSAELFM